MQAEPHRTSHIPAEPLPSSSNEFHSLTHSLSHTTVQLRERTSPPWIELGLTLLAEAQTCGIEPTLTLTILTKLGARYPSEASAVQVAMLISQAKAAHIPAVRVLEAVWYELLQSPRLDPIRTLNRAEFMHIAAETCENFALLEPEARKLWERFHDNQFHALGRGLCLSLISCVEVKGVRRVSFDQVQLHAETLIATASQPEDIQLAQAAFAIARGTPEFIDLLANSLITYFRTKQNYSQRDQLVITDRIRECIHTLNQVGRDSPEQLLNVLTAINEVIESGARPRSLSRSISFYNHAEASDYLPQALDVIPAIALLQHPRAPVQIGITFAKRLAQRNFDGPVKFKTSILEYGAHAAAAILARSGDENGYIVGKLHQFTDKTYNLRSPTFQGNNTKLISSLWEQRRRELHLAEIHPLYVFWRALNVHHGFGAWSIETKLPQFARSSLMHRFAAEHGFATFKVISRPEVAPEYALIVRGLTPERIFVAAGSGYDRFQHYAQAWPDHGRHIPRLAAATFVFGRGFIAVNADDSSRHGLVILNDHFHNPDGVVGFIAPTRSLYDVIFHDQFSSRSQFHRFLLEYCASRGDITLIRGTNLAHKHLHTQQALLELLDIFRIGYSQWKKGQTLGSESRQSIAPRSRTELFISEHETAMNPGAARMFHEAIAWHKLGRGGRVAPQKLPLLVVTNTLDTWSEPHVYASLDTYTLTLQRPDGKVQLTLGADGHDTSALLDWTNYMYPLVMDQGGNFREFRLVPRDKMRKI
jgi:hypothetical protein